MVKYTRLVGLQKNTKRRLSYSQKLHSNHITSIMRNTHRKHVTLKWKMVVLQYYSPILYIIVESNIRMIQQYKQIIQQIELEHKQNKDNLVH